MWQDDEDEETKEFQEADEEEDEQVRRGGALPNAMITRSVKKSGYETDGENMGMILESTGSWGYVLSFW